jgi:hypothetical protein
MEQQGKIEGKKFKRLSMMTMMMTMMVMMMTMVMVMMMVMMMTYEHSSLQLSPMMWKIFTSWT